MNIIVKKWGASLAIKLPRAVVRKLDLSVGKVLDIRAENGQLILSPCCKPKYTLASLVRGINASNRHDEIEVDGPRGRELF